MAKAINLSLDDALKMIKNGKMPSDEIAKIADIVDGAKKAKNISFRRREVSLEPIGKTAKTTKKSSEDLISAVSGIMAKMSVSAKAIEDHFGNSLTKNYIKLAQSAKTSKIAEQNALLAKFSTSVFEDIASSSSESFADFKRYRYEFESVNTLAESFANKLRIAGHDVTKDTEFVKKFAEQIWNSAEGVLAINKATGETKLQGVINKAQSAPVGKTNKATKETFESLDSLISKIINELGTSTKVLESKFGKNISGKLLEKSRKVAEGGTPKDFENATKYAYAAKFAALSVDAMSQSTAKSLAEFKNLNPEFENINALAENLANKMRQAGINIDATDPMIMKIAKEMEKVSKQAFAINKATGETNLQGILAQTEEVTKKQEQWNKLLGKMPDWFTEAKDALLSTTAAAVVVVGILMDKFADTAKSIGEMRKELGLSIPQTASLSVTMGETMAKTAKWAGSAEDAKNAIVALSNYSGDLSMATSDAAANIVKITKLTGLAAADAVKLNVMFKNTAGGSQAVADDLMNTAVNMARMNGLAPQKFMGELAANTDKFAGLTQEGVKGIIAATASASKLNIEFSKLVDVGNQFLDVQSLIEETMATNAMLGTNLDLSLAAAKYNVNDMQGFVGELVTQFKDIDLSKLTMIEKNQLLKSLPGFTAEQLQNIIKNADEYKKVGKSLTADMLKNAEQIKGVKSGFWDTLFGYATPQNMLLVLAAGKLIGGSLKMIGGGISWLSSKFATSNLMSKISGIFKVAPGAEKGPSMISKTFEGLGKINYSNLLKGAAAMAIMSAALIGLAFAMQQFANNERLWESFGAASAGITMLSVAILALGKIVSGGAWEMLLAGAGAMAIMAGALWILGNALQQFIGIDLSTLGIAAVALVGLTAALIGLGALVSGPLGVLLGIGIAVLIGMSIALSVFGESLQKVVAPILTLSSGLDKLLPAITSLGTLAASLTSIGIGLATMSIGLLGLSTGMISMITIIPGILLFTAAMFLLENKIFSFNSLIQSISSAFTNFSNSILTLSQNSLSLITTSIGLASIGTSLGLLTLGLLTVLPTIPILSLMSIKLVLLSGAFLLLGSSLQEINKAIPNLSGSFSNMKNSLESLLNMRLSLFELSAGFASLSIGLGIFAGLVGGVLGASIVASAAILTILSGSVLFLGKALQETTSTISTFISSATQLVPVITILSGLGITMASVGAGFAALGGGLLPLAVGLAALLPLIPVLSTLADISSNVFGASKEKETSGEPKTSITNQRGEIASAEKTELELLSDNISEIKDFLLNGGAGIYIDGRKVGSWLGKMQSNIHVLENRG